MREDRKQIRTKLVLHVDVKSRGSSCIAEVVDLSISGAFITKINFEVVNGDFIGIFARTLGDSHLCVARVLRVCEAGIAVEFDSK